MRDVSRPTTFVRKHDRDLVANGGYPNSPRYDVKINLCQLKLQEIAAIINPAQKCALSRE